MLCFTSAPAQERPIASASERPVVGLTLSGGGARGLAPVGVLRELERMRVPVDRIVGTSMGAIVGGLYAAGLSPARIEALVDTLDWSAILAERPPRDALGFRERALQRAYSFEMEIGLSGEGISLPGGLIAGQALEFALRRHTLPVASVEDFSRLPTPFAAVATDLERAEEVVLRSGDLVDAMRASMAIPVVFSPVELDGRILIDGGIVNNLPVGLAREAGADVSIAVDAAPRLETGPGVKTLTGVAEQLATIVSRRNVAGRIERADVAIVPELGDRTIFAYRDAAAIVEAGGAAVRAAADRLAPFALDEAAYSAWRLARAASPLPARIDGVEIVGSGRVDPRRLRARVELSPGDPLTADRLEAAARQIYSVGAFERVGYDLETRGDSTVAVLRAEEGTVGPSALRFGLRLVTESGAADHRAGTVTFTGVAAWTREAWNARGGASLVEARLGQTNGLLAEWHQPIDFAGRWFVEAGTSIESERQPFFRDRPSPTATEYDVLRRSVRIVSGREIGRSARAALGLARSWLDAESVPRALPTLPDVDEDVAAVEASFTVDRLSSASWPARGTFLEATIVAARRGLGSDRDWETATLEAKGFATSGRTTGFASLSARSGLGSDPPATEDARLGGFLSLSGIGRGALRGPYAGVARLGAYRRVASVPPALRGVFVGGWVEAGGAWRERDDVARDDLEWAGTLAIGAETPLGPLYLAWGRALDGQDGRVYVALGPEL
ncbi:MAG: patatin-like phospholipase family protein [Gemmatimonadota bacterium]|nr:patatin-like phospholipase family protein [Gemmatimonadota bacterium]